jgi:hypothetical protein
MCTAYLAMHVALKLQRTLYCPVSEFQIEKNYNVRERGMIYLLHQNE